MSEATPKKARRGPGRRRKSADAPDTEVLLLEAAAAAFGRLGFERTRLEDVALEAGITRPSLLHHFGSKRALYEATLRRAFTMLAEQVAGALRVDGSYEERVASLVDALVAFDGAHRALLSTIFRGVLREDDAARDEVRRAFLPLVDRMEAYVRDSAGDRFPPSYPVRAAILALITNQLTHSALGPFATEVWGGDAETTTIARALLLSGSPT